MQNQSNGAIAGTVYTLAVQDGKSIIVPSFPIQLVDDISKVCGNPFAGEAATGIAKSDSGPMNIAPAVLNKWNVGGIMSFGGHLFMLQPCAPEPASSVSKDDVVMVWIRQ